jgi:hypothetical protein
MRPDEPDDTSEDYGYDLAHEVPSGPDQHRPHRAHRPPVAQPHQPFDASTDYSSDEAHDL